MSLAGGKTLTAVYDLNFGTVAYDFVTWLARAKLEQARRNLQRLHVLIVPHTDGLARKWGPHDEAETAWRLWNLVIAACPLARASVTLQPSRDYPFRFPAGETWAPPGASHFLGPLVDAARAGETIPMLAPSAAAKRWAMRWTAGGRCVTLTLRNNNAADGRDSSPDWERFATWLRERDWQPLVVRDTRDVLGSAIGELSAVSIDLRAALYTSAAMNCFCHNGPMVLAWHTGAPYLAFNQALPADVWPVHWEQKLSLKSGEQLPWASAKQRLIYRPDTLDVMVQAFQETMSC